MKINMKTTVNIVKNEDKGNEPLHLSEDSSLQLWKINRNEQRFRFIQAILLLSIVAIRYNFFTPFIKSESTFAFVVVVVTCVVAISGRYIFDNAKKQVIKNHIINNNIEDTKGTSVKVKIHSDLLDKLLIISIVLLLIVEILNKF